MSCTFAAPPGTSATIRSISAWLSSTSGSISGVRDKHPSGIPFAGTSTSVDTPPTANASSASTGVVNRARTPTATPTPRLRPRSLTPPPRARPARREPGRRPPRRGAPCPRLLVLPDPPHPLDQLDRQERVPAQL